MLMNKIILKDKLKQIKNNTISIQIFNILKEDENFIYTIQNKGLLFDINKLNDFTINKINDLLSDTIKKEKFEYNSYFIDKFDNDIINNEIKRNINISKLKCIINL